MSRKKMNRGLSILLSFGMLTSCVIPANEFTLAMSAYAEETAADDINNSGPLFIDPVGKEGLIFNGEEQALVSDGSSSVIYSLEEDGIYSEDVPTGKNAGEYTVYYKVVYDDETDGPYRIDVTIAQANLESSMFESIGNQYYTDGNALEPKISLNKNYEGVAPEESDYTISYYNNTEILGADDTDGPYAEISASDNGNFSGSIILPFSIIEITYNINAGVKSWNSLLDDITFTSYKDVGDFEFDVIIDNANPSKTKIEYYISDTPMTESELETFVSWVTYNNNSKPKAEKNKKQIVYVKINDDSGKIKYICSDGIIIDNIAPIVSDVQLNDNTLTFKVDEVESDYYYLLLPVGEPMPSVAEIIEAAEDEGSTSIAGTGKVSSSDVESEITIKNLDLDTDTNYNAFVVARDNVYDINEADNEKLYHNTSKVASNLKVNVITNISELEQFRESVNNGNPYANEIIILDADIDMSGTSWIPIGNSTNPFNGIFEGNGHKINNININSATGDYQGFFGFVSNSGEVKNLGIVGGNVNGGNTVGGVVGNNRGRVMNCYSTAAVSGNSNVGGVAGQNSGSIINCYNTGTITISGEKANGVIGTNSGSVTNCYYIYDSSEDAPDSNISGSEAKTTEEFKSGEVAWLLQGEQTEQIWGQNIGVEEYPELTGDITKRSFKVTFVLNESNTSAIFTNPNKTVELPEGKSDNVNYEFLKWSLSDTVGGEEFTSETIVTEDVTVYAIFSEKINIQEDRNITTDYGRLKTQDLSKYIVYAGKATKAADMFTYEIVNGNDDLGASITGNNISIPVNAPVGEYVLEITANEKQLIKSVSSVGLVEYGTKNVTLEVNVTVSKVNPKITAPRSKNLTYDGSEQELVTPGTPVDGTTILFSTSENGEYSTKIPTGIDAGAYIVYYKVDGGSNYNDIKPTLINGVNIKKAKPNVTAPIANDLTYNGKEQELIQAGSTVGGTIQYSLDQINWDTKIPTAVDAGSYNVRYKIVGDSNYLDQADRPVRVTIRKATPEVIPPTAKELYYNGSEQELIIPGKTSGGEMRYSLNGRDYSAEIPTGIEAKTYTVSYRVIGGTNYSDTSASKFDVTINKAMPDVVPPKANELTYNGSEQELITAGSSNGGDMQYCIDGENYSTDIPTAIDAGTYTVYYKVDSSENYSGSEEASIEVTIEKATPEIVIPTANKLIYDGSKQELVIAGSSSNGDMQYSLDGESYSTNIPTGINAGTYTVYYKVDGNDNYNNVEAETIEVTIAKALPKVVAPIAKDDLIYNGSAQELIIAGSTDNGEMTYSLDEDGEYLASIPTAIDAGIYSIYYKVDGDENYEVITGMIKVEIKEELITTASSTVISTTTSTSLTTVSQNTTSSDITTSDVSTVTSSDITTSSDVSTVTSSDITTSSDVSTVTSSDITTSSDVSTVTSSDITTSDVSTVTSSDITTSDVSTVISSDVTTSDVSTVTSSDVTTSDVTTVSSDTTVSSSLSSSESSISSSVSSESTSVSTTAITTTTTPAITKYVLLGDADSNDKVNILDAALIAKKIAQRRTNELPFYADFNQDGRIDIIDAAEIAKKIAKRETKHWIRIIIIVRH